MVKRFLFYTGVGACIAGVIFGVIGLLLNDDPTVLFVSGGIILIGGIMGEIAARLD